MSLYFYFALHPGWLMVSCAVIGFSGAAFQSWWGRKNGWMDLPGHRSSHAIPTPKGGGIGLLIAFCVSAGVLGMPVPAILAAAAVSLVSLWGDRVALPAVLRLGCQLVCAAALMISCGVTDVRMLFLGVFIITGTANCYNFMDGINGIAGLTGCIGFFLAAVYLQEYGHMPPFWQMTALCLSAACLGFLPLNFPRATVFMGDVGSILMGFFFGALVMRGADSWTDRLALGTFLAPFYLDEITTMVVRLRDGESLLTAHRRHLYQLWANEGGAGHTRVTLGYAVLQVSIGLPVFYLRKWGFSALILYLGSVAIVFAGMSTRCRRTLER